jgi:hypothetical protein
MAAEQHATGSHERGRHAAAADVHEESAAAALRLHHVDFRSWRPGKHDNSSMQRLPHTTGHTRHCVDASRSHTLVQDTKTLEPALAMQHTGSTLSKPTRLSQPTHAPTTCQHSQIMPANTKIMPANTNTLSWRLPNSPLQDWATSSTRAHSPSHVGWVHIPLPG